MLGLALKVLIPLLMAGKRGWRWSHIMMARVS
jgi:hypothetical protein